MCQHETEGAVCFEEGLFGFGECHMFRPVSVSADSDALLILESLEEEGLSFLIMNPFFLKEDYNPVLSPDDLEKLGGGAQSDYSWYVICTERTPACESTVNLRCPIVVNTVTRRAKQVILEDGSYGFRHRLAEFTGREKESC